jgi:hypothetical protein
MCIVKADRAEKLRLLQANPYFDTLEEASLRELERSGAIRTANRRITVADPSLLEQWTLGPWN